MRAYQQAAGTVTSEHVLLGGPEWWDTHGARWRQDNAGRPGPRDPLAPPCAVSGEMTAFCSTGQPGGKLAETVSSRLPLYVLDDPTLIPQWGFPPWEQDIYGRTCKASLSQLQVCKFEKVFQRCDIYEPSKAQGCVTLADTHPAFHAWLYAGL
eukprot:358436-Chlamydomonas_euryale.AAC.5